MWEGWGGEESPVEVEGCNICPEIVDVIRVGRILIGGPLGWRRSFQVDLNLRNILVVDAVESG